MTELKPCPFCGGEAEVVERQPFEWCDRVYYVRCRSMKCDNRTGIEERKKEAIKVWNRRAGDGNAD